MQVILKITLLFASILLIHPGRTYAQTNLEGRRIGLVVNIEGPFKLYRNYKYNNIERDEGLNADDKFFGVVKFLGSEKMNSLGRIKEYYLTALNSNGIEAVIINDTYDDDYQKIKEVYNVPQVLVVNGEFGLELEKLGAITGDKRTHVSLYHRINDTNTGEIDERFKVIGIRNIRKKDLINPPNYPNVQESMNRLLEEKIKPKIDARITKLASQD